MHSLIYTCFTNTGQDPRASPVRGSVLRLCYWFFHGYILLAENNTSVLHLSTQKTPKCFPNEEGSVPASRDHIIHPRKAPALRHCTQSLAKSCAGKEQRLPYHSLHTTKGKDKQVECHLPEWDMVRIQNPQLSPCLSSYHWHPSCSRNPTCLFVSSLTSFTAQALTIPPPRARLLFCNLSLLLPRFCY